MIEIINCDQGSAEWFAARLGVPSASEFATVIAQPNGPNSLPQPIMDAMIKSGCTATQLASAIKASRKKYGAEASARLSYMRRLAGEILTGEPAESYTNLAMERGKVMEDEARDLYSLMMDVEPIRVGFIKNGVAGCSPDSLVGEDGGLEIKSAAAHIQIERLQKGIFPPEHKAQVQGGLWVTGRKWWDFCSYCPKLPPLIVRVERDEEYIATIERAVRVFAVELNETVKQIRNYGERAAA